MTDDIQDIGIKAAQQLRERSQTGTPVDLPSGIRVLFKRVNLPALVARGIIPTELLRQALSGFPELDTDMDVNNPAAAQNAADALMSMRKFSQAVIGAGLVAPRLVDNPDPDAGEIDYDTLAENEEDINALMSIAQMPVTRWEMFLQEQRGRVPAVDNGEKPEPAAE